MCSITVTQFQRSIESKGYGIYLSSEKQQCRIQREACQGKERKNFAWQALDILAYCNNL